MKKPVLIVRDNLLMPLSATEARIIEIEKEVTAAKSKLILNGLFLMLVSYIESMQKKMLIYFLKYQPESISKKNTIEIGKSILAKNADFNLIENFAKDHVERMPYWQLAEAFYEVLKIDKPSNNANIQNIKERRNQLIHSNLEIDYKHKRASHEYVDQAYIANAINDFAKYLNELKDQINRHYSKYTKINALKTLWKYTFNTPLCSRFDDYWQVDAENDSIFAYKIADQESGLSHSERFMLGIWRSQVAGYKVDFLNMASLDDHMQNCLHIFLKLSNDIFLY